MMLTNFLALAYPSFKVKNFKRYFSTSYIIEGFLIATLLSIFLYLSYYDIIDQISLKVVNSINALLGFYLLLRSDKKVLFWSGFFIGALWFYWIGFSFRYYEIAYLIPLMALFVSIAYGMIFWIIGIFKSPIIKALVFLGVSLVHPMNFNWFIPQIILIDTFFGIQLWQFSLFLLGIALFITLKSWYKYASLLLLIASINWMGYPKLTPSKQKIFLASTSVTQDIKWELSYKDESIQNNLNIIYDAIDKNYDIVILPESVFALFINAQPNLQKKLQDISKEITIVAGGLYSDGIDAYNSTYYFINGEIKLAHKVVLVPFGEEIPLPSFLKNYINKIFYNGAKDYQTADKPTDIEINTETFRNAICYEATREEIFVSEPKLMIAMSNNAWFTPSIEPTLQNYLLRYFSIKYGTVIYHSSNRGGTTVIK